jgi:hypothetical protein
MVTHNVGREARRGMWRGGEEGDGPMGRTTWVGRGSGSVGFGCFYICTLVR